MNDTFQSPYDDCGGVRCDTLNGKPFTLVREIVDEDDNHHADAIPMYRIRIEDFEFDAWPEEIGR